MYGTLPYNYVYHIHIAIATTINLNYYISKLTMYRYVINIL